MSSKQSNTPTSTSTDQSTTDDIEPDRPIMTPTTDDDFDSREELRSYAVDSPGRASEAAIGNNPIR